MRVVILFSALLLAGCGIPVKYVGWGPSPYPKETCGDHGCRWNDAKAQCECGEFMGIQPTPMP